MRRTTRRRLAGFTLVEVAISTMIVAASAGVFFALMPMSFKTGKMVGSYQQCSSLLQHKVDQMRGVGYGRLTYNELRDAGIIDASPNTQPYSFKGVDGLNSIYSVPTATVEITDYSATVRQVKVRLQWTGSSMRQGRGDMTVTALIAKG
jgi:type II secretory pathway pseudopilin PulG